MSTEKKSPHPIATMAAPTPEAMQEALITLAWHCREEAGACERYLDSDTPDVDFDKVAPPAQLAALATACSALASTLGATEASSFFLASSAHLSSAGAHLLGHFVYEPILVDQPNNKLFADMHDDERRFAARATKLGRQLTHRGLSKLAEMWPDAYDVDEDVRDGEDA